MYHSYSHGSSGAKWHGRGGGGPGATLMDEKQKAWSQTRAGLCQIQWGTLYRIQLVVLVTAVGTSNEMSACSLYGWELWAIHETQTAAPVSPLAVYEPPTGHAFTHYEVRLHFVFQNVVRIRADG